MVLTRRQHGWSGRRTALWTAVALAVVATCVSSAAAAGPDPKTLVVKNGPAGFTFTEGHSISNSDVSDGGNVGVGIVITWGRVGGYRVEFSAGPDGRVRDSASVYGNQDGAAKGLVAEAGDAAKGLVEADPPLTLGQETHYYASREGTPEAQVERALAWREGSVVAVLYERGTTLGSLGDLATTQEALIRTAFGTGGQTTAASATTTTAAATTATETATDAATTATTGKSKSSFPLWVVIAGAIVVVLLFRLVRARRTRA